ncbi:hypothetical protein IFM89_036671 [Coptis chinensis]|uniref:Uncharacterized protein n=1 Tax=Coptis chinensis TaxID=261450 RepID=A0A835LXH1_9MAGN|nr:hypothetical protein IFM89_036671 [Coptis chinensis]
MACISKQAPLAKRLEGKVTLITGGSRAIGEKTVRLFVSHGAKVAIADILDNLGHSLCKEIGLGENVSFIHCGVIEENDVRNAIDNTIAKHGVIEENDVRNAIDTTIAKHGELDILFNTVGISGEFVLFLSSSQISISALFNGLDLTTLRNRIKMDRSLFFSKSKGATTKGLGLKWAGLHMFIGLNKIQVGLIKVYPNFHIVAQVSRNFFNFYLGNPVGRKAKALLQLKNSLMKQFFSGKAKKYRCTVEMNCVVESIARYLTLPEICECVI